MRPTFRPAMRSLGAEKYPSLRPFPQNQPGVIPRQSRFHHSGSGGHNFDADAVSGNQADAQCVRFVFLVHISALNRA